MNTTPMDYSWMLWAVITTALLFDFVNGWNDSANAIATVVGTRVLSPLKAVALAATLNMAGAFMGDQVAKTVGGGLVSPDLVSHTVLIAAMGGAILWAAAMTLVGLPISGSHSLIGGLLGAAVAKAGIHVVIAKGVTKTLIAMLVSPVLGFIGAYLLFLLIVRFFRNRPAGSTGRVFGRLQLVSVSGMSLMHGANDAQKVMGIVTLGLVLEGAQPSLEAGIPTWVIIVCGLSISLGTAVGGWKVIKTLGYGLSRLKPVDGFAAETAATAVLYWVKELGVPVSTTHTITGAILGVGATKGVASVRWGLGRKILLAWIFTLPSVMAISGLLYWVLWAGFAMDQQPEPPWKASAQVVEKVVRLEWPEVRRATAYRVYRYARTETQIREEQKKHRSYSLRDPKTEKLLAEHLSDHVFVDQTVQPGRQYVYLLRSSNAHGLSRFSKEFAVDVPPEKDGPAPK